VVQDPEFNPTVAAGLVVTTVPAASASRPWSAARSRSRCPKGPDLVTVPDVTGLKRADRPPARVQAAGLAVNEVVGSPEPTRLRSPTRPSSPGSLRGSAVKLYTSLSRRLPSAPGAMGYKTTRRQQGRTAWAHWTDG